MQSKSAKLDQYWASVTDHTLLLDELDERVKNYFDDLRSTGLLTVYERAYRAYYGGRITSNSLGSALFESSKLTQGGKQGQKTRLKANHHRNVLRHLHQLTTSQKPEVRARASNTDYKSQAQTILGNGLIDYYWREKNLGNIVKDAAEISLAIYGESFVHAPWELNEGDVFGMDSAGQPIYTGEQKYEIKTPMEVIRDPALQDFNKSDWVILRLRTNRWELIADFPAFEEELKAASGFGTDSNNDIPVFQLRGGREPKNDDLIDQFILYHRKCKALPEGRMVVYIKDAVLFDGPIPYRNIPVRRLCAEKLSDTIYGYTVAWDLLGVQDGIDELHTILMSNNKTFGMQAIWHKFDDGVSVSTLEGGMKLFKSNEPPVPLQLTKSAPESYTYLDKLEHTLELLSGISSTVRGNPESNLKSGNALALVVSQSVQFASSLEESINRAVEELGMDLIYNLIDFSQTPRTANIVGKSNLSFMKEFSAGEDLNEINRVVVEQVNPVSKTIAGRAEIANNLLQQGMIKSSEDYLQVLATGQLGVATDSDQTERLAIQAAMEGLRDGTAYTPLITDNHPLYVKHLKGVIASPAEREDLQLVQNTTQLIQQHIMLWRSMDPALMMLLGMSPPPPAPMPMSPEPQQGNPAAQAADNQGMPSMPSLPDGAPPQAEQDYEQVQQASPFQSPK